MPPGPEDQLKRLLAAEEAAIEDDGFTERVMDRTGEADWTLVWRRTALYGAGLVGLGFAVGGIVEMAPHLPNLSAWFDSLAGSLSGSSLQDAVRSASDAAQFGIVAVLAGLTFLVAGVTLQNR